MTCAECGLGFTPTVARPGRRFCSRTCQKHASNATRPGRNRDTLSCLGCGVSPIPRTMRYCTINCRYLAARRRRLVVVRGAEGIHTGAEFLSLQRRYGGLCAYCGEAPGLYRDHVVPLTRGGTDYIGNILPCCWSCNSKKNDRLLVEWRYERPRPMYTVG